MVNDEYILFKFKNRPDLIKKLKEIFPELENYSNQQFSRVRCSKGMVDFEILINKGSIYSVYPEIRIDSPIGEYFNMDCCLTNEFGYYKIQDASYNWFHKVKKFKDKN